MDEDPRVLFLVFSSSFRARGCRLHSREQAAFTASANGCAQFLSIVRDDSPLQHQKMYPPSCPAVGGKAFSLSDHDPAEQECVWEMEPFHLDACNSVACPIFVSFL